MTYLIGRRGSAAELLFVRHHRPWSLPRPSTAVSPKAGKTGGRSERRCFQMLFLNKTGKHEVVDHATKFSVFAISLSHELCEIRTKVRCADHDMRPAMEQGALPAAVDLPNLINLSMSSLVAG